jgi:hypothetical protein
MLRTNVNGKLQKNMQRIEGGLLLFGQKIQLGQWVSKFYNK